MAEGCRGTVRQPKATISQGDSAYFGYYRVAFQAVNTRCMSSDSRLGDGDSAGRHRESRHRAVYAAAFGHRVPPGYPYR